MNALEKKPVSMSEARDGLHFFSKMMSYSSLIVTSVIFFLYHTFLEKACEFPSMQIEPVRNKFPCGWDS